MQSFQPLYLVWHQSTTVLSVFGLSSAMDSWPEDYCLLHALCWCLKPSNFVFALLLTSTGFPFVSILELRDICSLRDAFKCLSSWLLVSVNGGFLEVVSITKVIFSFHSDIQSFLLISQCKKKKKETCYVAYIQSRSSNVVCAGCAGSISVRMLELTFGHTAAVCSSSLSVFSIFLRAAPSSWISLILIHNEFLLW